MKKQILLLFLFVLSCTSVISQFTFKVQTGFSYIEYYSVGFGCSFSEKHTVSFLYGSKFFIHPQNISSFMLQYDNKLKKIRFNDKMVARLGIKGGYSIYTNKYYKWQLLAIVPFLGMDYSVNTKIAIGVEIGTVISRELSLKRINYGELGKYRQFLPELKIVFFLNV